MAALILGIWAGLGVGAGAGAGAGLGVGLWAVAGAGWAGSFATGLGESCDWKLI